MNWNHSPSLPSPKLRSTRWLLSVSSTNLRSKRDTAHHRGYLTTSADAALVEVWRRLLRRYASLKGEPPKSLQRPGRNDPCPCGSGSKYKKCHLRLQSGIEPAAKLQDVPTGQIIDAWRSGAEGYSVCFGGGCSRRGIEAHSIQRARTLARISDSNNHVLGFDVQLDTAGHQRVRTVGIRRASTFPGFCPEHDKTIFQAIEDQPFRATPEQCFLLAFRALAQMHAFKIIDFRGKGEVSALLSAKRVVDAQLEWLPWSAAYTLKVILDLAEHLTEASCVHTFRLFDEWTTCIMRFAGTLSVAGVGCVGPEVGIAGEPLQDARDLDRRMEIICHSVIALEDDRHAVVLSWPAGQSIGRRVGEAIAGRGTSAADAFLEYMFLNHSNVFFSREWWEHHLDDNMRAWLGTLAAAIDGKPPDRGSIMKSSSQRQFLPWRLQGIEWLEGKKGQAADLASLVTLGKIEQAIELARGLKT